MDPITLSEDCVEGRGSGNVERLDERRVIDLIRIFDVSIGQRGIVFRRVLHGTGNLQERYRKFRDTGDRSDERENGVEDGEGRGARVGVTGRATRSFRFMRGRSLVNKSTRKTDF